MNWTPACAGVTDLIRDSLMQLRFIPAEQARIIVHEQSDYPNLLRYHVAASRIPASIVCVGM
jgi:hypothetical protein